MQTAVVWSCFQFIRSGQNHLARHSERGKKTRQTKVEVGRQHQGMDGPEVWQVPEGRGEQRKMEKTGCKIICGAPMTLTVKGLMMMMMIPLLEWNRGHMTGFGKEDRFHTPIIIIINPLTARVVGAPQMILQPVFSIFPCSPLPSGTCRTPGLFIP